jgi:hypothetical protein
MQCFLRSDTAADDLFSHKPKYFIWIGISNYLKGCHSISPSPLTCYQHVSCQRYIASILRLKYWF